MTNENIIKWSPYEHLIATILLQARRDYSDDEHICDWFEDRVTYAKDVQEFLKSDFFFSICSVLDIPADDLIKSIEESVNDFSEEYLEKA